MPRRRAAQDAPWMHVKRWLNTLGGTRDDMIQERLDEWRFHREYLRAGSHEYNFWKMLRVISITGWEAKVQCDNRPNRP